MLALGGNIGLAPVREAAAVSVCGIDNRCNLGKGSCLDPLSLRSGPRARRSLAVRHVMLSSDVFYSLVAVIEAGTAIRLLVAH